MKKVLFLCLFFISFLLSAQISLGVGSTVTNRAPVVLTNEYSYVQQIFTKQEINTNAAGNITGLKFYLDPTTDIANSSDWVVYLGHTPKTNFLSETDWIPVSQLMQVFAGTVTNNNGLVEIVFPTPFPYNNIDNLVLAADENRPGYNSDGFYVYPSSPDATLSISYYSINIDPASPMLGAWLGAFKSVITINGLTENTTPACPIITYPANNATLIPLSPSIAWNTVSGATGYKVSIGTTPGGTDIVNQQVVTINSFNPSPLNSSTSYYVKVLAFGAGGESSGCSENTFTTIPHAPLNDNCSEAYNLTVNPDLSCGAVGSGTTLGATGSIVNAPTCFGVNTDDDVWFKFIATKTSHLISFKNITSVGTIFDHSLSYQVLGGTCGNLTSILCSHQSFDILSGLTVGDTYYVRVYSPAGAGFNQSFDVCIGTFPPPPVNDVCGKAIMVNTFPYTYTQLDAPGSTNNNGFISACYPMYLFGGMNDGLWYSFVGDGSLVNIKTTTATMNTDTNIEFNIKLAVYTGNCNAYSCVKMADGQDSGHLGWEHLSVQTVLGATYYVNVGSYSGGTDDPEDVFTITITKGTLGTSEASETKDDIEVYPNPFTDVVNISDIKNVKSISVFDVSGRLIKTIEKPSTELYLGELKSGIYLITLTMKDDLKQTIKAIKK